MKENDANHYVQRFTFDVEVERQSDAKPIQDQLSALFRNRLERMLEQLLDEVDDPHYVVKIDTIEVDLGVVSEASLEGQIYYKIREALEKKIRKRVRTILANTIPDRDLGEKVPLTPAKIELITYFLQHGRMPFGGEIFKESIETMFRDLIRNHPTEVRSMLARVLPQSHRAARRIVRQFGRNTLEDLIRLTAPAHVFYLQNQEQDLLDRSTGVLSYGRSTVREEIRVALLRYLFARPEQRFSVKTYREQVAKMLSEKLGSPAGVLLSGQEEQTGKGTESRPEAVRAMRYRSVIVRALREGVEKIPGHTLMEAWEYLVRNEPEALRAAIGKAAGSPASVARLFEELPLAAIRMLVERVLTQASAEVLEVLVAVVAAHAELARGNRADERFVRAAYSALVYELASDGVVDLAQSAIAEAMQRHLRSIPEAPRELLDRWEELEIPGVKTAAQKEQEKREALEKATEEARVEEERQRIEKEREELSKGRQDRVPDQPEDGREEEEADKEERIRKAREEQEKREQAGPDDEKVPADEELSEIGQAKREALKKEEEAAREREAQEKKEREAQEEKERTAEGEELDPDWPLPISRKEAEEEIAAAREAEQDGVVDARPLELRRPRLPESLFEGEEEEERRRTVLGLGEPEDPTESFALITETGRIEYIMYYFRYGTDPWWVSNLRQRDIQALVVRLGKSETRRLVDATRELIFRTPPSVYPEVAGRIITALDEVERLRYLEKVVPDLVGFMATTVRALSLFYEAKRGDINAPAWMSTAQTFAWQVPLQYVMRYLSSRPSAAQLLRYVIKEVAAVIGMTTEDLIKGLDEVAETALESGERRFSPFRTLLPEPEEAMEVPVPIAHPGAPDEDEIEDEAATGREEEGRKRAAAEGEEEGVLRREPEDGQDEELFLERDGQETGDGRPEDESPDKDLTAALEPDEPEKDGKELRDEKDRKKPADTGDDPEKEQDQRESEEKALPDLEDEAAKRRRRARGEETDEEREERLALEKQAGQVTGDDWPGEDGEPAEILPPSIAELLDDEQESIRIIQYYLRYGALPHQESQRLSRELFRKLVLETMVRHERAYVQMVRNISDNLKVRLRLVSLGEEVAVQSILHINWMAGSPLQPFLDSILKLVRTPGSPVEADPVMEHALFYITSSAGSAFKAADYVKALFRYLERYYRVPQLELVRFLIRKNEESSVQVKAILNEILEMIRRSVEHREEKKKPAKPEDPRFGPGGIPEDIEIFVENAGMVLVWPFLYQYFQRLGLMNEERLFKDEESMEKGAHMLQYMVTRELNAPEEKLFLNKLMVGLPLDYPMHLEVEISDTEKEMTDSMLRAVADQWSMMKGAPPEQLRATFLVRDGLIKKEKDDENWLLQVEKKGYDMVLKRLPWGLVQIRVPWLEYMINVEWG